MTHRIHSAMPGDRLSAEALDANFGDLHAPLSDLQAMTAADHCIYCYDAPCITACPTSIDIPTFIHQIRTRNIDGAAKTILGQNIMGGTCARACPTEVLCEQACVRNHGGEKPVEIGLLQRYAVDHLLEKDGDHPFERAPESGKRVAVVGAGPAGLSCAHRLAMLGHMVVVYEARAKSGGLNEYGLATYKMVDDFAQKEVEFILEIGGIEVRHNKRLGDNLSLAELRDTFDAVFLGIGLGNTNALSIDEESLDGVVDAIDFIENLRQVANLADMPVGDDVVVIGGGNTAIDAAVQVKRLGAENVTLVYRRGEDTMSATDWEIDLARANGVAMKTWAQPVAINGNGRVVSVTFERTRQDENGFSGTGKTFDLPADMILKAIGQKLNIADVEGFELDGGKLKVSENFETSIRGIYAGGDCVRSGEDLTVQAVEGGKCAAHAIDEFLKNA